MKFEYTQNPTAKTPIILIDKYIGTNSAGITGIDENQFTKEVLSLKNAGVTEAEIWVNSKGGLWSTSVGIVSAMNNSGINFTTYNMGFADSAAGHIFQAGKHRVWMPQAIGLIHEIQGVGSANVLEAMNASVAVMLCEKTNKSADDVRELMKNNTMMDATMAEQYGFCDEVAKTGVQNILSFTNSSDAYEAGQEQIKKLLPKNKSMEALNSILGLQNEASADAQLAAIKAIIDAKNVAETQITTLTEQLTTATNSVTDLTGQLATANNAILTAENAVKATKAEALVKEHLGTRIVDTPENILMFTNLAIDNYDNAKKIIEAINVNIKAPKMEQKKANPNVITNVAQYMGYTGK